METIFEQVTKRLIGSHQTITFMESCTAGLLASLLTDTEGASAIFRGSIVTYSNEEKIRAGVDPEIIRKNGVYSAECARSMALAACSKYKTDFAVGITGTTGNVDPENSDSQTGKVYFCILHKNSFYDFEGTVEVSGCSRQKIKMQFAGLVFEKLNHILNQVSPV